jgi:hypothetical protein
LNASAAGKAAMHLLQGMQMNEKKVSDKMFLRNAKSMVILNGTAHPGMVAQMPADIITDQGPADVVLLFAKNRDELEQFFPLAKAALGEKGSLWIAYYKSTASKATDINRDSINAFAKENGITGVAMISVDGDWSALRLKRIEL